MARSIRKSISLTAATALVLFVIISFAVSFACVRSVGNKYQKALAESALDFAEITIDADKARESFLTRNASDEYESVKSNLLSYQSENSDSIKRISLISFSNSSGSYI